MAHLPKTTTITTLFSGTSLQKKWRHIRDAFNREKRRISGTQSGSGAIRKSQYMYYNMLSFLHTASLTSNTQQFLSVEDRDPDDDDDIQPTEDSETPATEPDYYTTFLGKKRKAHDEIGKQLINIQILKDLAYERRQHEEETLRDEDRLFLMSLVTDFKNIPQNRKLSAKRQILLVIEQHQQGDSYNMDHAGPSIK